MSQVRTVSTTITNSSRLSRACDRMREAGFKVTGPRYEKNYPGQRYPDKKVEAWLVNLGGYSDAVFFCDEQGSVNHDTDARYGGAIKTFDRLQSEYLVAGIEEEAQAIGGMLSIEVAADGVEMDLVLTH